VTNGQKLMERRYDITPSVSATGEPQYTLWYSYADFMNYGVRKVAENKDRTVLEKAIEHLTQGKSEEQK
jgi:hypothetical protein